MYFRRYPRKPEISEKIFYFVPALFKKSLKNKFTLPLSRRYIMIPSNLRFEVSSFYKVIVRVDPILNLLYKYNFLSGI